MKPTKALSLLHQALYLIFFTSLICSFRAITSISIGLILLTGLLTNRASLSSLVQKKTDTIFIAGCTLFFLLQLFSLLYTNNQEEGWDQFRIKSGLMVTPLAFYCSGYLDSKTSRKLFFSFCLLLAAASVYCLAIVFSLYLKSGDGSIFFYHQLVSPLRQHAVYFSLFVFVALVFLLESIKKKDDGGRNAIYIVLIIYFSAFLFFLSSKLVLGFYILYMIYYFIRGFNNSGKRKIVSLGLMILFVISVTLVLTIPNPISNRFSEIVKGDMALVKQEQYSPANSFNGLHFRMLQWKLVPEILNDNQAWLEGVSPGDGQYYLDKKYISKNMYTGDPQRKDRGFLGYNTHNQFLESLLQNGVIGLLVFLFTCFFLIKMTWQIRHSGSVFIILMLLAYALTESVFETQYGIIIFTFFPLSLYWSETKTGPPQKPAN